MASRGFRAGLALASSGALALGLGSCNRADHPPPPGIAAAPTASVPDGGIVIDGTLAKDPLNCGGQNIPAIINPPLLYFVFDDSGSMSELIDDVGGTTKYAAALGAVGSVLQSIGHRVRYGAVLYPADGGSSSCAPGREVFAPTLGDALSTVPAGGRGPILRKFLNRLSAFPPGGSTPTAATLAAILPRAAALGDDISIVLLTDGAPNCNTKAACTSATCIPDIEHLGFEDGVCGVQMSCCDPKLLGAGAGANCIDEDATEAAVAALHEAGIDTYVVGMPGSEIYGNLLDRLAQAGGTARPTEPLYYAVSAAKALGDALFEIGTGLAIKCEIELETPPVDADLVNLSFDGKVVLLDPENGWDWSSEAALSVRGESCTLLRSGAVREVQVVYGCRTVVR
jgi:hypothetical protein